MFGTLLGMPTIPLSAYGDTAALRAEVGQSGAPVRSLSSIITEAGAAGVYTGAIVLPAGSTLVDVIIVADALWTAGSSATLKCGDATDDDGIFTAVNLKATDLLAGESISVGLAGGKEGADIAGSQFNRRYSASARTINTIITTTGTTASTGITRTTVLFSRPQDTDVVTGTKA